MADTNTDTPASPPEPPTQLRHSGHGIASLTISLLSWIGFFILLTMQGELTATSDVKPLPNPVEYVLVKGILEPISAWVAQVFMVLLLPLLGFAFILALIFAIGGLLQTDRDKMSAWLGSALSGTGLAAVITISIVLAFHHA